MWPWSRDTKSSRYICAILSKAVLIFGPYFTLFLLTSSFINKCDKTPTYLYLAKHLSRMMLFIYQRYSQAWRGHHLYYYINSMSNTCGQKCLLHQYCWQYQEHMGLMGLMMFFQTNQPHGGLRKAILVLIFKKPSSLTSVLLKLLFAALPCVSEDTYFSDATLTHHEVDKQRQNLKAV